MSEAPPLSIAELDVVSKFGLDKPEEATVPLLPTRGIRGPWGYPKVRGVCPSCGALALFAASGGYITCANLQCPNPTAVADSLEKPVVLSPKDEPTADDSRKAFIRWYEDSIGRHPVLQGGEGLLWEAWQVSRATVRSDPNAAPEPSQPKLDPEPWARLHWSEHPAHEHRSEWKQHGFQFKPRPEFSQYESQYPHRKA